MEFSGLMAMGDEIARIEIGDAEQAVIARRHLFVIGTLRQTGTGQIQIAQETRIVRAEHHDPHYKRRVIAMKMAELSSLD